MKRSESAIWAHRSISAEDPHLQYLRVDGYRPMQGDLDMNGFDILNLGLINGFIDIEQLAIEVGNILASLDGYVTSVFGRTGDIIAVAGDYNSDQINNSSFISGVTVSDALETLNALIVGGGNGTVYGPPTTTDNAIVRWNGIDGYNIQNSGIIISDSDVVTGVTSINGVVIEAHAIRHEFGGSDQIDGYNLSVVYSPSNYISPINNKLGEYLYAIDDALGGTSLVDGTRPFTGPVGGVSPIALTDLATKGYVDAFIQGIVWQEPVINRTLTAPPGSPNTGDRYIVAAPATGAWAGQEDKIAEWNGTSWVFTTPTEGFSAWVTSEDYLYVFVTSWQVLGSVINHSNLLNLSVDSHLQYLRVDGYRPMSGDLDMGLNDIINVGLIDGVDVSGHASRHEAGGADQIDGYNLAITFSPTNYTPSDNVIGGHLDGIDIALGLIGSESKYQTIQEDGVSLTQRQTINFIGLAITAVDDPGNNRTNVTVSAQGPNRSIQFNNNDEFDGSGDALFYDTSSVERVIVLSSNSGANNYTGIRYNKSTAANINDESARTALDENANLFRIQTFDTTKLALNGGTDDLIWPAADGYVGQKLTTDGYGNLSWTDDAAGSAVGPSGAIQYSNGSGVFQGTAKFGIIANGTTATVLRIDSANNLTSTNAGFQIRNSAGIPQITINYNEVTGVRDLSAAGAFGINPSGDLRLGGLNAGNPTLIIPTLSAASKQVTWPSQDSSTPNYVLKTNAAGTLSWSDGYSVSLTYNPSNYTSPINDNIGEHIAAIDDAIGNITSSLGTEVGFETYPIPDITGFSQVGSAAANVYAIYASLHIPIAAVKVSTLTTFVNQVLSSSIALAIYDLTGAVLAKTAITPAVAGFNNLPIIGGPITLFPGVGYYMAVWGDNQATVSNKTVNAAGQVALPYFGIQGPNIAGTVVPTNIGPSGINILGSPSTERFWMAGF